MASPLTVTRNDYHTNPKESTVHTPIGVAHSSLTFSTETSTSISLIRRSARAALPTLGPKAGARCLGLKSMGHSSRHILIATGKGDLRT